MKSKILKFLLVFKIVMITWSVRHQLDQKYKVEISNTLDFSINVIQHENEQFASRERGELSTLSNSV